MPAAKPLHISAQTRRRFLMGLHGLYPGRRWSEKHGVLTAVRAMGGLQVDPLNVFARSHDIALYGRVHRYDMRDLDSLLYKERQLFDWGGLLLIQPMDTLPHWRVVMERRKQTRRYKDLMANHAQEVAEVLQTVRERGPMMSADFSAKAVIHTTGYRTTKSSGQALYHLWLTGELMTHSRRKFQRVYDLTERVAPPQYRHVSSEAEAEAYLTRLLWTQTGLVRPAKRFHTALRYQFERNVSVSEGAERLDALIARGEILPVTVDGSKEVYYAHTDDYGHLEALHAGGVPDAWQPVESSTDDEVVFFAPLEMVSARGRAKTLFDFDYLWEVYKPVEKRRWGYYTLPALYRDRLVARIDPRLDRASDTLQVLGAWLEPHAPIDDAAFASAMARGLRQFASFAGAAQVDVSAVQPDSVRSWLTALLAK